MEIEYAFLARYADLSSDGTLSILGAGLEVVRAPSFPRTLPLAVVARLNDINDASVPIVLEFDATTTEGKSILAAPFVIPLELHRLPPADKVTSDKSGNVVLGLAGFLIPSPGEYILRLKLTGESVLDRVFRLTAVQQHA